MCAPHWNQLGDIAIGGQGRRHNEATRVLSAAELAAAQQDATAAMNAGEAAAAWRQRRLRSTLSTGSGVIGQSTVMGSAARTAGGGAAGGGSGGRPPGPGGSIMNRYA